MNYAELIIKYLGRLGLLVLLIIFIILNPEKINIWASWFHIYIFRRFFRASQRKSVSLELQGKINEFKKSLNNKMPGILSYGIRIKWMHRENITRRTFIDKDQVVVILKSYEDQDINFVTAVLVYLSKSLIPYAKQYISENSRKAIDFVYAKKIIKERKTHSTLDYFLNEVLNPELQKDTNLRDNCSMMDNLDNSGILTSIFMNELIILSRKLDLSTPTTQVIYESRDFIIFLNKLACKKKDEDVLLDFVRRHIRISISPIAIKEKFREVGVGPYRNAIEGNLRKGIYRNYIVACGEENVHAAKKVVYSMKNVKKIKKVREIKYKRAFLEGKETIATTFILDLEPN